MDKTGQKFEMNPDTCTLQNIFAMELHRFQDKIADIVNCAIKELAIERVKEYRERSFLQYGHLRAFMACNY